MRIFAAFVFAILVIVIVVLGIVGQQDYDEQIREDEEYKEMTELYKSTGGQYGWPDYKKSSL